MINLHPIGIMQGRAVPATLERLQVFPNKWEEEFGVVKEIGFIHIELLDDKENHLRELLQNDRQGFFDTVLASGLQCSSVCADQLCSYSLLQNPTEFKERISGLVSMLEGHGAFTIVVPFFDENKIYSAEELKKALEELVVFDAILQKRGFRFALEIDLPAEEIVRGFEGFAFTSIGVCYDIGNSIGNGFPVREEITKLGNAIVHVHVKDKENGKNVRLAANEEKLRDAFSALKEIGYKGLFTLETCITPVPREEAELNLQTTKKLSAP